MLRLPFDGTGDNRRAILHVFSTFAVGGQQTRFTAIANHFGRRYRHAIIAMDGNYACRERLNAELDVVFPYLPGEVAGTFANLVRWRGSLRQLEPDLLATYNWGAIEWAMANHAVPFLAQPLVPHIHIEDGFGQDERRRQLRRRSVVRRLYLRRSTVIVPSQTLMRIATRIWRLDPARVVYIPNGIDADVQRERAAGPWSWPRDIQVIGTVAALRPEKNLDRLLRAFRRVTEQIPVRLVIVGDGPERSRLQCLARELGLSSIVHFLGHTPQPRDLYPGFDVFALSSDTEQMPITVLEAMAASLAVVAPDVGDIRHMVAAENEPLISGANDEALAASLLLVLRDAELRRRAGVANRAKAVRDFREDAMFEAYRRLFDDAPLRPCSDRARRFWPGQREPHPVKEPLSWKG